VALRAFPVIYARDVEVVAAFYTRLGFREEFRMAAEDGSPESCACSVTGPSSA
jgi:hypothetical protein